MIINNQEFVFPAVSKISFFKVFESLERLSKDADSSRAAYATSLLEELAPYPELRDGFIDQSLLETYKPEIQKLLNVLFPEALLVNEIKGITPPFEFKPFFASTRYHNIIKAAGPNYELAMDGMNFDDYYIIGCLVILGQYYKYPIDISQPLTLAIPNKDQNSIRQYRLAFNADLIEVIPPKDIPKITRDDYLELINNFDNIKMWKKTFPPDSWTMRGIGVLNLFDVTMDYSIAGLTTGLFEKNDDLLNTVQNNMRSIFNIPDLCVSFVHFANNSFQQIKKHNAKSFLLGDIDSGLPKEILCDQAVTQLFSNKESLVLTDVTTFDQNAPSLMSKNLLDQGIHSYILAPLYYDDEIKGFLEMASENAYALNYLSVKKLENVLPILSIAAARFSEEAKNKIDAIIQEECTTIHSSVKWRFEEEATKFMHNRYMGKDPSFKDLVFKNIYPLYGQLDIKQSSTLRNNAVRSDLSLQLTEVKTLLNKAYKKKPLPSYEELVFRVDSFLKEMEDDLLAGSEHKILSFLKADIYPVFNHLKEVDSELGKAIDEYRSKLDSETTMIYDKRKDFDESVTTINRTLAAYIDKKQLEAQEMFPHYFERYKTDGVEYNMYIGQSLVKNHTFDRFYLNNLRIWQLIVMCEMEDEFRKLQGTLKHKLEIASLVLSHSNPLSIHFRLDEKRFDIEGAYNARYEVVKKRVDKAKIKGTNERLTVPGKIVIVYSNEEDAFDYAKYLNYLISKGYIKSNSIEDLELENLQGITGLKALRATIQYTSEASSRDSLSLDELIGSIETETLERN